MSSENKMVCEKAASAVHALDDVLPLLMDFAVWEVCYNAANALRKVALCKAQTHMDEREECESCAHRYACKTKQKQPQLK